MNPPKPSQGAVFAAYAIAILCDLAQLPLTLGSLTIVMTGPIEVFDLGFDIAVMAALSLLLGFNVALVPAIIAEAVPFLDLLPVWTAIVFFIRWKQTRQSLVIQPVPSRQVVDLPKTQASLAIRPQPRPKGAVIEAEIVTPATNPPDLTSGNDPKT